MGNELQAAAVGRSASGELTGRIEMAIKKAAEANRAIFIVTLQIENMTQFRKKRSDTTVHGLLRELFNAVRQAVHPSQFVAPYQDGLGLVFDAVDPGKVDTIAKRLISLTQHVIKTGKYNDLTSRWTDILQQFLWPNNPGLLFPKVGWAIYPRDGATAEALMARARASVVELSR